MRPRAKRAAIGMICAFGVIGLAQGCRSPTQAILHISFNGPCTGGASIGIITGTDPLDAERRIQNGIFTTTADCVTGNVGTLVVTPNDATGSAAIVVVAGVGKSGRACLGASGYEDCILARRRFAFVEHASLDIPIPLDLDCKSVPCDAMSTCDQKKCASSAIECTDQGCLPPGKQADGGTVFVDAPTDPDAYVNTDGAIGVDGSPPDDSGTDAPVDGGGEAGLCENQHDPVACNRTVGGPTGCPSTTHTCCWGFSMPDGGPADGGIDAMTGASGYDCRTSGCTERSDQPGVRCKSAKNCAPGEKCCRAQPYGGSMCTASPTCPNFFGGPDGGTGGQQYCEESCECGSGKTCSLATVSFGSPTMQTLRLCE